MTMLREAIRSKGKAQHEARLRQSISGGYWEFQSVVSLNQAGFPAVQTSPQRFPPPLT